MQTETALPERQACLTFAYSLSEASLNFSLSEVSKNAMGDLAGIASDNRELGTEKQKV